ncbi:MAG: hypothetical protein ACRDOL_22965 [Streptosporangiaceae bacterium]
MFLTRHEPIGPGRFLQPRVEPEIAFAELDQGTERRLERDVLGWRTFAWRLAISLQARRSSGGYARRHE